MVQRPKARCSCVAGLALTFVLFSACVGDPPSASQQGSPDGSADASGDGAQAGGDGSTSDDGATASESGTTDAGCAVNHLLVNEVRSRGANGTADEFIELFNPTATIITLDSTWTLQVRAYSAASELVAWTGSGKKIPAHGYFLVGGTGYTQSPAADEAMTNPVTDASNVVLRHSTTTVDVVCFAYNVTTSNTLIDDATYGCGGTPADNSPHNDSSTGGSNVDQSLRRGHCVDSNDDSKDFVKTMPATPESTASPPDP